ncbi:MAG TPA: hypothetical protein VN455_11520, partial [Methanotrichaceae archaeon]|nr:hypothetical protein [Methanotrichaceae archaeon]
VYLTKSAHFLTSVKEVNDMACASSAANPKGIDNRYEDAQLDICISVILLKHLGVQAAVLT